MIKVLPPKTTEEVVAKEMERKARTTLLMALLEDHLAKFHKMDDKKEMWEAIKSRFGTTASSSNTQNVAFLSADNASSTNDVSTTYSVSSPSVLKSQKEGSSSYTDEVIHSFFANQSSAPQLDYNDLEKINDDMEEMDLKCRRRDVGYNGNKTRDNGRRPAYQDDSTALVTIDGEDIDWSGYVKEDAQNYAMMAYSSSNSGSDNESVFMNKTSDLEDTPVNDRFVDGIHVVPPLITENYMPSGPDVELDYSKFIYNPKQTSADESDSKPSEYASCESDSSVETSTSMPKPVKNAPKVVCEPKVWTDAPIIEEYELDSDNDLVSNVQEDKEKPSFAFTDSVKHEKTSRENIKETGINNHSPKIEKQDRNCHTRKGLGYTFTRKACFVCGSFSHLIRDCDFHQKRMAKQAELTKSKYQVTSQRENKPVWNNVQRDDLHRALKDKEIFDSGCSRNMTGNKAHLADYQEFKGDFVSFGGSNGRITSKGKIKAGRLNFEDVYYVEELKHYNLFSVSQICDKKNKVLFTDTDCLVLSPDFKLPDENQESNTRPLVRPRQSDNGTEFKNNDLIELCGLKEIKREYSNAKTLQQNGVAERKNITFIKVVRTVLAYSFLPTTFWAEAVNTACYVLNKVLVTKPQNKTPYELLTGKQPIIGYLRPFGCHVTILNTINPLGKFDRKSDSGFLVGHSLNSKAFRVYNLETKRVEENLHVNFLENKPNVAGKGHVWMFDLDYLTNSMNYELILVENQANKSEGPKEANNNAGDKIEKSTNFKTCEKPEESYSSIQNASTSSTNQINVASTPLSTASPSRAFNNGELSYPDDPSIPYLEDIYASPSEGIFTDSSYNDEGVVINFHNLETTVNVSLTPTTRIHTIHPKTQILRDPMSAIQTRIKVNKNFEAHALRQEEGIDYNEVFAPVARIEAIRIFLAFASYTSFIVFQIDVKRAFLYGTIDEEVYVSQPPSFVDHKFPNMVYKVVKALYGLHQALRAWYATFSTFLEKIGYRRGAIDKTLFIKQNKKDIMLVQVYVDDIIFGKLTFFLGLQVKQKEDGIFISQDKYVAEILKKFDFISVKTVSTPIKTQKPLVKDEEADDMDVYLYSSMIGSLMYLTASRPDIMFAIYTCSRKSTTGGCQFLGRRLISWQCKKETIMATSTTEAEYVAATHCCGQVLWIHNQLLDYVFNFMNTKIYMDNESIICIVKNPVFHSKTKHIEIRHHFIRDAYEKKLIQVLKIHTDDNVADLLTKAFDVSMFNLLVVNNGLLNL
nr:retrovirus-related Pol polyprotein from transposon TNT 1-94 [Tanacetum cinerariifolium]